MRLRVNAGPHVGGVSRTGLLHRVLMSGVRNVRIIAPAGYGKTRFARELARHLGVGGSIDCRNMRDIRSSVQLVLPMLGPFSPEFQRRVMRQTLVLHNASQNDDRWMDVLEEAVCRQEGAGWFWLDNAEALSPEAAAVVDRVIRNPARCALICSRTDPHIPALSRIPPNEYYRISIDDLRFTDVESAALFGERGENDAVKAAIALARGWPVAALMFASVHRDGRLSDLLGGLQSASPARPAAFEPLNEHLAALSLDAKVILAAIALLVRTTADDVAILCSHVKKDPGELTSSPFILENSGILEIHPIAADEVAPYHAAARAILKQAAAGPVSPLRAAQFYIAAGDHEHAARMFDQAPSPISLAKVSADLALIVESIDRGTVVRHAAMWCATASFLALSPREYLSEARAAWRALDSSAPVELRVGVAWALLNALLIVSNLPLEAGRLLLTLEKFARNKAAHSLVFAMTRLWRSCIRFRSGVAFDSAEFDREILPELSATPLGALQYALFLQGPALFLAGDREASRRAFASAIETSVNAQSDTYQALALSDGAFHAWLCGEDLLFKHYVAELQKTAGRDVYDGTRHFIACASEPRPSKSPEGFETKHMRAAGFLIAAAREEDGGRRRTAARAALDAAVAGGEAWLTALCHLCLGLCDSSVRAESFDQALKISARVEYPDFGRNVCSVTCGTVPPQWAALAAFSSSAPQSFADLRVSLSSCEIWLKNNPISLSHREMELLLALAVSRSGYDRQTLASIIWPELDAVDGLNAVTVNISRLRKRLNDPRRIQLGPTGYRVAGGFELDLFTLEEWNRQQKPGLLPAPLEQLVSLHHNRLPQWILTREWLAPYAHRYDAAIHALREARLARAIRTQDETGAAHYRRLLDAEGPEG